MPRPRPASASLRYGTSCRRRSGRRSPARRGLRPGPSTTRAAGPSSSLSNDHLRKKPIPNRMATTPTHVAQRAPIRCSRSSDGRATGVSTGGVTGGVGTSTGAMGGGVGTTLALAHGALARPPPPREQRPARREQRPARVSRLDRGDHELALRARRCAPRRRSAPTGGAQRLHARAAMKMATSGRMTPKRKRPKRTLITVSLWKRLHQGRAATAPVFGAAERRRAHSARVRATRERYWSA